MHWGFALGVTQILGLALGGNANFSIFIYQPVGIGNAKLSHWGSEGRRQNSSVAFGDFLQRMTNLGWQGFAAQLHPYHMLG